MKGGDNNMVDLVRHDPFRSLFAWPHWLDEWESGTSSQRGLKIRETDKNIIVEAVVAGVPANDVEVHIEDGVLTIKAEKSTEEKNKGEYKASSYQYYYTVALSGGQWNKTNADVEDGVVEVKIPKTEAAKPRKITVKAKSKK